MYITKQYQFPRQLCESVQDLVMEIYTQLFSHLYLLHTAVSSLAPSSKIEFEIKIKIKDNDIENCEDSLQFVERIARRLFFQKFILLSMA